MSTKNTIEKATRAAAETYIDTALDDLAEKAVLVEMLATCDHLDKPIDMGHGITWCYRCGTIKSGGNTHEPFTVSASRKK